MTPTSSGEYVSIFDYRALEAEKNAVEFQRDEAIALLALACDELKALRPMTVPLTAVLDEFLARSSHGA